MNFEVKISAIGEVRDKDGNLISSEPVVFTQTMTADEVRNLIEGEPE